jgi:tetratricopeptide (TPR) repeat protein
MTEIRRKQFPEAEDSFRRALEIQLALADDPAKPAHWDEGHWHDLAATYVNLSSLYLQTNRPQQAAESLQKSLAIYEQLPQFSTEKQFREGQASTLKRLAAANLKLRQFERASDAYLEAETRFKKLAKDFPDLPVYSQMAAETEADLGMLAAMAKKPAAAAIEHYRAAIHEFKRLSTQYPKSSAYPLAIISNLYNIRLLHLDVQQSEAADQDWRDIVKVVGQAAAVRTLTAADLKNDTSLMLLRTDSKFPELLQEAAKAAMGQPPEHD